MCFPLSDFVSKEKEKGFALKCFLNAVSQVRSCLRNMENSGYSPGYFSAPSAIERIVLRVGVDVFEAHFGFFLFGFSLLSHPHCRALSR